MLKIVPTVEIVHILPYSQNGGMDLRKTQYGTVLRNKSGEFFLLTPEEVTNIITAFKFSDIITEPIQTPQQTIKG